MKIMFVDVRDIEDRLTWSGITSNILERFRASEDLILCHKLSRASRIVFIPIVIYSRLTGWIMQTDRYRAVQKNYARQVMRAYEAHRPDVIFSTSTIPVAYLPPSVPVVTWCDAVFADMINFYWPTSRFERRTLQEGTTSDIEAIRKSRASIYSSEWAAMGARRIAPEAGERIHFVPFGANNAAEPPRQDAKALPRNMDTQRIIFLFVGAEWERKGGPECVDALSTLRREGINLRLDIVGAEPFDSASKPDFVVQHGFLRASVAEQRERLAKLFDDAHFFILPSRAECAGIVFAEAASHGLPIISRDVGGISSMVAVGENSILVGPQESSSALCQAIATILANGDQYTRMSQASLDLYRSRLNWDICCGRVLDIIASVVDPSKLKR